MNFYCFRMESMPSQDTDLTELKMSSFYSAEEMLKQTEDDHEATTANLTNSTIDTKDTNGDSVLPQSRTMMTMSSVVSEYDQFRSQDCLVRKDLLHLSTTIDRVKLQWKNSTTKDTICFNYSSSLLVADRVNDIY